MTTRSDIAGPAQHEPSGRSLRVELRDLVLTAAGIVGVMALVFRYLLIYDKSNVWVIDGLAQHFPELYFWNQWVRGILANPTGPVELWSWNLGLGADIIGTLAFPIVGDPFAWITLAFPMARMEAALLALFLIKIVVAGLVAAAYFRVMGARALPAWVGSVVYVFASFLLVLGLRHQYFVLPMIFLPLVLIGVERLLRGRGAWFFTVAVAAAAYANFYFFYMITIIGFVYTLVRVFDFAEKTRRWRSILALMGKVTLHYLLGVLLAAPLLVPAGVAVMQTARSQAEHTMRLLYDPAFYRVFAASFMSAVPGLRSTNLGIVALGVVITAAAFARPSAPRVLRVMPVALFLGLCVPAVGSIMNGMSFPSNRFIFALPLFAGALVALRFSDDEPFSVGEIGAMATATAVSAAVVLLVVRPLSIVHVAPLLVAAATVLLLATEAWRSRHAATSSRDTALGPRRGDGGGLSWARWAAVALVVVNVGLNATYMYGVDHGDLLDEYVERHEVLDTFEENPGAIVSELGLPEGARATNGRTVEYNSSMVQGFPGTSFYYSTMSAPVSDYRAEIDLVSGWSQFSFDGVDERAMASSLLGVEYYVTHPDRTHHVPFGFEITRETDDVVVLRNRYALPFGFVFDSAIDRQAYLALEPADRESAMLQGAVMDRADIGDLPVIEPVPDARPLEVSVVSAEGAKIDLEAGTMVRSVPEASIVVSIEPVSDVELYVQLDGIFDVVTPRDGKGDTRGQFGSGTVSSAPGVKWPTQPAHSRMIYSAGNMTKYARWQTPGYSYYWGRDSQLVNLGYSKKQRDSVEIRPREAGEMTFDSLKVFARPMEPFVGYVEGLRERPLTDLELDTNRVSGSVSTKKPGILFLSIPYSPGWSATVDGAKQPVFRVNTGFSGVKLEPGTHRVELTYVTPGLVQGLALGAAGLLAVLALLAWGALRGRMAESKPE